MLDPSKINPNVLSDIEENCDHVHLLSVEEAFDYYLQYNGIIGYTSQILEALRSLQSSEVIANSITKIRSQNAKVTTQDVWARIADHQEE